MLELERKYASEADDLYNNLLLQLFLRIGLSPKMLPFKYKLTIIILFLILLSAIAEYWAVLNEMENKFKIQISNSLQGKVESVIKRLKDKEKESILFANSFRSNTDILNRIIRKGEPTLTSRNQFLQNEALNTFNESEFFVFMTDSKGEILASGNTKLIKGGIDYSELAVKTKPVLDVLESGELTLDFVILNNNPFQLVVTPVWLEDSLEATICIGTPIDNETFENISGDMELVLFRNKKLLMSTPWDFYKKKKGHPSNQALENMLDLDAAVKLNIESNEMMGPYIKKFNDERFLYVLRPYENPNREKIAQIALVQSLDMPLHELQKSFTSAYLLAVIFIIPLVAVIGFWISRKVTRHLITLQEATKNIKNENFAYRVDIKTNDEFHQLGESFNLMAAGLQDRQKIRSLMDKIVSKEIAERMLTREVVLGGEEKIATIVFCDLRGFTTLSEGMNPTELLALLNGYFTMVGGCIDKHQGVIDKYIGDAFMALFGVPFTQELDAVSAVRAALDIEKNLKSLNLTLKEKFSKTVEIGIGINTGNLIAGNMGAENRLNYTVIGDAVNSASRLEGVSKIYQTAIIISEGTVNRIRELKMENEFHFFELDTVIVQGKTEAIKIFGVLSEDQYQDSFSASFLKLFQEGREEILKKNYQQALNCFQSILSHWPENGPALAFKNRCQTYLENPSQYATDHKRDTFILRKK